MDDSNWQKSSYSFSNGNCVEWRTSSYSAGGNCLEARHDGTVQVRDSKLGDASPVLTFGGSTWGRFIAGLKATATA